MLTLYPLSLLAVQYAALSAATTQSGSIRGATWLGALAPATTVLKLITLAATAAATYIFFILSSLRYPK
jgi:hypothetical protein